MRTYCTLFDSKYAAFGIALYRSLLRFDNQFHLFILCLDEDIYRVLSSLQLEKVTLVSKSQLYPHIFTAVQDRMTAAQMCWLAQPLFCQYLLENFPLDHVVYMDSDCYFMNSPEPIWKEISDKGQVSATMVPHRFPQNLRHLEPVSGKFCVQFNYFTKDTEALNVLKKWTDDCLTYSKEHSNIYPGQISLDSWSQVSKNTHTIQNEWAGVAPWNLLNVNWPSVRSNPTIFYHFHGLYLLEDETWDLGHFQLPKEVVRTIYRPYIKELLEIRKELESRFPGIEFLRIKKKESGTLKGHIKQAWLNFKRIVKSKYNIYSVQKIEQF